MKYVDNEAEPSANGNAPLVTTKIVSPLVSSDTLQSSVPSTDDTSDSSDPNSDSSSDESAGTAQASKKADGGKQKSGLVCPNKVTSQGLRKAKALCYSSSSR